MSPTDTLPHVDSRVVDEVFAGIEMEMGNILDGFGIMDSQAANHGQFAEPNGPVAPPQGAAPQIPHSGAYPPGQHHHAGYPQGGHIPGFNPASFNGVASRPEFAEHHGFPSHPNARGPPGMPPGAFPPGMHMYGRESPGFPPKGPFDLDDLPKESRRPPSPRVDPQKQQQKWADDEKLGGMATISPVLYANLEHPKLKEEFPGKLALQQQQQQQRQFLYYYPMN